MGFGSGVGNPFSATSRAGRKMEVAALRWAKHECKLNTTYYARQEIADKYKNTYVHTNPDGYVYFEYRFVKRTRMHKIPLTREGVSAEKLYYYYGGELTSRKPSGYKDNKDLARIEAENIKRFRGNFAD